jgi:16S rRNA (cytidine1402-2'-O)-methyltransferase
VRDSSLTEVFYEAPHRIKEAVEDIAEVLGAGRRVVIAREVTKLHEEFLRGSAGEIVAVLSARGEVRGEITLLIGEASEGEPVESRISVHARVQQVMDDEKIDEKAALKRVAKEFGISKSEAYREWQRGK